MIHGTGTHGDPHGIIMDTAVGTTLGTMVIQAGTTLGTMATQDGTDGTVAGMATCHHITADGTVAGIHIGTITTTIRHTTELAEEMMYGTDPENLSQAAERA